MSALEDAWDATPDQPSTPPAPAPSSLEAAWDSSPEELTEPTKPPSDALGSTVPEGLGDGKGSLEPSSLPSRVETPDQLGDLVTGEVRTPQDDALDAILNQSVKQQPDRQAGIIGLMKATGLDKGVVERRYDEVKQAVERSQYSSTKLRLERPEIADFLLKNPDAGAIVLKDQVFNVLTEKLKLGWNLLSSAAFQQKVETELSMKRLNGEISDEEFQKEHTRLQEAFRNEDLNPKPQQLQFQRNPIAQEEGAARVPLISMDAYQRGYLGASRRGELGVQIMEADLAGRNSFEAQKELVEVDRQLRPQDYGQGPWEQLAVDAAQGVGSMVSIIEQGGVWGGVAGLAAYAGTLVITKNPALATKAATSAASIMGTTVTAHRSWTIQTGDAYLNYRDLKTDKGEAVSKEVAAGMAIAEGFVTMGLEMMSLKALGAVNKPFADMLRRQEGRAFLNRMLADDTFRRLAADVAKAHTKATLSEAGEEAAQHVAEDLFGYMAKVAQAGELQKADPIATLAGATETFLQSMPSAALMSSGSTVTLGAEAVRRSKAYLSEPRIKAINETAKGSKTVEMAPQVVAEAIARTTAETGEPVTAIHIEAGDMLTLFQENNADVNQAATELLGEDGPQVLRDTAAAGGRIAVPMERYLEKFAGKPIAEALADVSTTNAFEATPRQLKAEEQQANQRAKELADQYLKENTPPESEAEYRLVEVVQRQLAKSKRPYDANTARTAVALQRAFLRTQAERFNKSPDELFSQYVIRVERALDESEPAPGETVDDGFEFGANIEAPEAELGTLLDEAKDAISKMAPDNRAMAEAWLKYTQGETTERPKGTPREIVLKLANFGVVDPEGFDYGVAARARPQKTAAQRARKGKGRGAEPSALKNARMMRADPGWMDRPYGYYEQSANLRPEELFAQALAKVEDSIRLYPDEHLFLLDPTGRVVFQKTDNKESSVGLTTAQLEAARSFGTITITHNHPSGGPLSPDDIALAIVGNLQEIRAVTKTGDVFRIRRPEGGGGWGDVRLTPSYHKALRDQLESTYQVSLNAARMDMDDAIRAAGGDPKDGRNAKGYNDEQWIEFLVKRVTEGWNRYSENYGLGWRVERLKGAGLSEASRASDSNRRQSSDVPTKLFQDNDIGPRGFVQFVREGANRVANVVLGKNADLSTFLHESGHIFLELMGDLVERPDAPQQLKDDYQRTLQFLGAASRADIKREHHEKWARAFEAYLFEGKPPSANLARAFWRFKLWMKAVYRDLSSLNVQLDENIRGVFDRLLATDTELERTKRAMGLDKPMFRSPEEAGMSPEEWQAYLEAQRKAASRGARAAEFRILKDKLRETEEWWKEEEKALQLEALKDYENRKDVIAFNYLKHGKLPEEWGGQTELGGRLDREAVENLVGEEWGRSFRLVKEGGENPDDVAELLGYATGKELLEAVISVPEARQWTAEVARQRMLAKHPDILQDREKLREMVAKGMHGDATVEWLLREWKALRSKLGQGVPPIEAIKGAAKLIAEKRRLGHLEVGATQNAERSAANKAQLAAARGNFAEAAVFKQQQLLNMYLYRELVQAKEEREAFEVLTAKLSKEPARRRLGKASPVYRDGVDQILEALDLKEKEKREVPLASIDAVVQTLEDNAETVAFDPQAIALLVAQPKPISDLTLPELRNISAAIKNIRQAAINRTTTIVGDKRIDKEIAKEGLIRSAMNSLPSLGDVTSTVASQSMIEAGMSLASGVDGSLLKPEVMLKWAGTDGDLKSFMNSMWFKAVVLPLQKAKHREADLLKSTVRPIVEAFERVPESVRKRFGEAVDGRALFPNHKKGIQPPRQRFELLMMALNAGNASNLDRLTRGRQITKEEVQNAINLLTKEEMDWVQSVFDAAESLWPLSRELEERDTGLAPEKIEATPIKTPHGEYRGGYFPAAYDNRVSQTGQKQEGAALAAMFDPSYRRPGTSRGHLKSRADDFADVISLEPGVIYAHLAQVAHDIAFRETLKSVGNLILDPDVDAVLKERLGPGRARVFTQWLKDIGGMRGAEVGAHTRDMTAIFKKVRSNFVVGTLGFSAPTALGDLSNYALAARNLKKKHWAAGILEFYKQPWEAVAFAQEKSGELRTRENDLRERYDRNMKKLVKGRNIFNSGPLGWVNDHAFTFFEWSDKATSTPTWIAAYRQSIAEGLAEEDAVNFADAYVRDSFPSHNAVDQAAIMRDKGFWGGQLLFYGFFSQTYSITRDAAHPLHTAAGWRGKLATLPKVSAQILGIMTAIGPVAEYLSGRGPDDDDGKEGSVERWASWFLRKLLLAPLQLFPFRDVTAIGEALITGKKPSYRAAPGFGVLEPFYRAIEESLKGKPDSEKVILSVLRAIGLAKGIPTRPLQSVKYGVELVEGKQEPRNPFDVGSGVIYGARENQPDNPLSTLGDVISSEKKK